MNFQKALIEAMKQKQGPDFILIGTQYGERIVLPYAQGLVFIESLNGAEVFDSNYNTNRILPMDSSRFTFTTLSRDEYDLYKIAALMDVTFNEAKEARDAASKPNTGTHQSGSEPPF